MKENVHRGAHTLTGIMFAPSVIMFRYLNDRIDSAYLQMFSFAFHYESSLNNRRQLNDNYLLSNSF